MGYMHINNLYKDTRVLMFKEVYAMEKIHGTSAHISWKENRIHLYSGGCKLSIFENMLDQDNLRKQFEEFGQDSVVIFGELYGGKMQGMAKTYGKETKFIVFEVKVGDTWLTVPTAEKIALKFGLEFVHYNRVPATIEALDKEREAYSVQAIRNGMGADKQREGIVIRPLEEMVDYRGNRVITKYKNDDFRETATPRKVGDPAKRLAGIRVAEEWVTDMRLRHIIDKIPEELDIKMTGKIINAMVEDITREGGEEVSMTKETRAAISKATVKKFHDLLHHRLLHPED